MPDAEVKMVKGTIRNLIFDLGGVVIRFDGNYFMDREGITDPEDRKLLMEVLFAGPDWPRIDLGELDEPELLELAKKKLPERLHAAAERLVLHWADPVEIIPILLIFQFLEKYLIGGLTAGGVKG